MPNETTPAEGTGKEQATPAGVNTGTPENKTEPVVETIAYNGFNIPKPVYTELKTSVWQEAQRKLMKDLQEQGKLVTDDVSAKLEQLTKMTAAPIDESKNLKTKEDWESYVNRTVDEKTTRMKTELETLRLKLQEKETENAYITESVKMQRKREVIADQALKLGVQPEYVNDFVSLTIMDQPLDFDDQGKLVVKTNNGDTVFDSQGAPLGIDRLVQEQIQRRQIFVKPATTGGAGGTYQQKTTGDNYPNMPKARANLLEPVATVDTRFTMGPGKKA